MSETEMKLTPEERQRRIAQQWPQPRPELEAQWVELERLEEELKRKYFAKHEEEQRVLQFHHRKKFRLGLIAEEIVLHVLRKSGEYVIETRNTCLDRDNPHEQFAPKMRSNDDEVLLGDFLCAKDGCSRYAEAKYKTYCSVTRMTKQYENPIDLSHRDQYLKLQRVSGIPVFLFMWQSDIKRLFYRRIDLLGDGRESSNLGDRLVYWPVSDFHLWDGGWIDD